MEKEFFILELEQCREMVLEMIGIAEKSSILNSQAYYTLRDGLLALIDSMKTT